MKNEFQKNINFNDNKELKMAYDFVSQTDITIFLTGKAGTGKTTFLHYLKDNLPKRMVVVAPTGVAAINAGAVTIHSFFQLPFGPFIPGAKNADNPYSLELNQRRIRKEKRMIIRRMELLIIDEISMVRADILDAIDYVLREYRKNDRPFGGVQLLLIGDLHQLPPVLKDEEKKILSDYYPSMYFFSSHAIQRTRTITIELKNIYRQKDAFFIELLEKVRMRQMDSEVYNILNSRFIPNFEPADNDGYIILTTHNATAHSINSNKLETLREKSHFFTASIEGDFPPYSYPTDYTLELKIGAQVMFVKNDPSPKKLYFNGKIGIVENIKETQIIVRLPDEKISFAVGIEEWENIKYSFDENTKEIKEELVGKFMQFPLKLAWAITIHKSQGLTFDKAVIDAGASFAHGQAYVALSRCRSFEGIVLLSPIGQRSVISDTVVSRFTEDARKQEPTAEDFQKAQMDFEKKILIELFDFEFITRQIYRLHRFFEENLWTIFPEICDQLKKGYEAYYHSIFEVSDRFIQQIQNTVREALPSNNESFSERIKNACRYFEEHIDKTLTEIVEISKLDIDNGALMADLSQLSADLDFRVYVKHNIFKALMTGFSIQKYLESRSAAEMDYFEKGDNEETDIYKKNQKNSTIINLPHPMLYGMLRKWRSEFAAIKEVSETNVIPQKVLVQLCKTLPMNEKQLIDCKGFGKNKTAEFGHEVLLIIKEYCDKAKNGIEVDTEIKSLKKGETFELSYRMTMLGYTIDQIAAERKLSTKTIAGHLVRFIERGDLSAERLMDIEKLRILFDHLEHNSQSKLMELKHYFGNEFSIEELQIGMAEWRKQMSMQ